ncbi:MarR family transcriptional regulator [Clostridium sp. E02]|uniref:MarR family winged helix-turn-helix transcriptional regulator n=1 Tax=Clostridium sp. E02 TaxID=2487134 RepID=UPI000F5325E6|nr:MarR family transcriptional regulator [Clostridium sp. E02]
MNKQKQSNDQTCSLNSCLFFSTSKLAREFGKIAEEAFSKTGLSPSHALLLYLVNQKKEIQQKELGETLHLTPSTITRLIEKLERRRLVEKLSAGKHVYLKPTPEGLAMQDEIMTAWDKLHEKYSNILTEDETAQFLKLSGKLLEQLNQS